MSLAEKCDICGKFTEPYVGNLSVKYIDMGDYDVKHRNYKESGCIYRVCNDCYQSVVRHLDILSYKNADKNTEETGVKNVRFEIKTM